MKIVKKRVIACFIDEMILGAFYTLAIKKYVMLAPNELGGLIGFAIVLLLFFRDILFRNASIGKKIMRIAVFDENWERPGFKKMVFRSIASFTIGYAWLCKIKFIGGDIIDFLEWERKKFGIRVADKKVLKKLRKEAESLPGDQKENLSRLYDEKLAVLYPRK